MLLCYLRKLYDTRMGDGVQLVCRQVCLMPFTNEHLHRESTLNGSKVSAQSRLKKRTKSIKFVHKVNSLEFRNDHQIQNCVQEFVIFYLIKEIIFASSPVRRKMTASFQSGISPLPILNNFAAIILYIKLVLSFHSEY